MQVDEQCSVSQCAGLRLGAGGYGKNMVNQSWQILAQLDALHDLHEREILPLESLNVDVDAMIASNAA